MRGTGDGAGGVKTDQTAVRGAGQDEFAGRPGQHRARWWEGLWWPLARWAARVRVWVRVRGPEFFHRGRRGWAPSDTWNLDAYLSRVMGETLARLAESTHGWPGEDSEWPSLEEWQAELRTQAGALLAYANSETASEGWMARAEANARAVARLAEYWGQLWD